MLSYLIWTFHIMVCLGMVVVILVQADKSGGIQGAFGGGGSQVAFGASSSVSPVVKLTAFVAIGFMCTSLFLSFQSNYQAKSGVSQINRVIDIGKIDLTLPEMVKE